MKMTRIVYHIAGKDYEDTQAVIMTFNVLAVSIQNFLTLAKSNHCHVEWFGKIYTDSQQTTTNGDMKSFKIKAYSPAYLVAFAKALGKYDHMDLDDNWNIRNSNLRAVDFTRCQNTRFNGLSVFDPATKMTAFKSNSPVKMTGKQMIINGKLWRKFYASSKMR